MASMIKATTFNTFPLFDNFQLGPLMDGHHVWDSWFVMTEDNQVAVVAGFKVLIALARKLEDPENERIAYFYSSDGVTYKCGGYLFGDKKISPAAREWSGSTILRDDGRLQTFYTVAEGADFGDGVFQTKQFFATAHQTFSVDKQGALVIAPPKQHRILKDPDGEYYETALMAAEKEKKWPTRHRRDQGSDQTENFCFRDPKFFKDPRTKIAYILFEANTGSKKYPSGFVREEYLGYGSDPDYKLNYEMSTDAIKANGCVGIIELTNTEYDFGKFHEPWLTSNLVTDEIERINVVVSGGYYYLFVATHGNKNVLVTENPDLSNRDLLLGFRAKSLFGKLEPLNDSGVVLQQKSLGLPYQGQDDNYQYVYSWLIVPTDEVGVFDCISYADYCKDEKGNIVPIKTAGPTVKIRISGRDTDISDMRYDILPAPK